MHDSLRGWGRWLTAGKDLSRDAAFEVVEGINGDRENVRKVRPAVSFRFTV